MLQTALYALNQPKGHVGDKADIAVGVFDFKPGPLFLGIEDFEGEAWGVRDQGSAWMKGQQKKQLEPTLKS